MTKGVVFCDTQTLQQLTDQNDNIDRLETANHSLRDELARVGLYGHDDGDDE